MLHPPCCIDCFTIITCPWLQHDYTNHCLSLKAYIQHSQPNTSLWIMVQHSHFSIFHLHENVTKLHWSQFGLSAEEPLASTRGRSVAKQTDPNSGVLLCMWDSLTTGLQHTSWSLSWGSHSGMKHSVSCSSTSASKTSIPYVLKGSTCAKQGYRRCVAWEPHQYSTFTDSVASFWRKQTMNFRYNPAEERCCLRMIPLLV